MVFKCLEMSWESFKVNLSMSQIFGPTFTSRIWNEYYLSSNFIKELYDSSWFCHLHWMWWRLTMINLSTALCSQLAGCLGRKSTYGNCTFNFWPAIGSKTNVTRPVEIHRWSLRNWAQGAGQGNCCHTFHIQSSNTAFSQSLSKRYQNVHVCTY